MVAGDGDDNVNTGWLARRCAAAPPAIIVVNLAVTCYWDGGKYRHARAMVAVMAAERGAKGVRRPRSGKAQNDEELDQ